jgi:hypothetical protein
MARSDRQVVTPAIVPRSRGCVHSERHRCNRNAAGALGPPKVRSEAPPSPAQETGRPRRHSRRLRGLVGLRCRDSRRTDCTRGQVSVRLRTSPIARRRMRSYPSVKSRFSPQQLLSPRCPPFLEESSCPLAVERWYGSVYCVVAEVAHRPPTGVTPIAFIAPILDSARLSSLSSTLQTSRIQFFAVRGVGGESWLG